VGAVCSSDEKSPMTAMRVISIRASSGSNNARIGAFLRKRLLDDIM
jgi:hypothetical protein